MLRLHRRRQRWQGNLSRKKTARSSRISCKTLQNLFQDFVA
jgi:hypothetical protein